MFTKISIYILLLVANSGIFIFLYKCDLAPWQCPDSYHGYPALNNKCIKILEKTVSWSKQQVACVGDYSRTVASLVTIEAPTEQAFINTLLPKFTEYYIGLLGDNKNQMYQWIDPNVNFTNTSYTNWAENRGYSGYECVCLNTHPGRVGKWVYCRCGGYQPAVCQIYLNTSAPIPTIPSNQEPCPTGYELAMNNCYKISTRELNWKESSTDCKRQGARLASIHNDLENDAIFYRTHNVLNTWIGAQREGSADGSGNFKWSDGFPFEYSNWKSSPGRLGRCVYMNQEGTWETAECTDRKNYVCRITNETAPTVPSITEGSCPDQSWESFGAYCYKFVSASGIELNNAIVQCSHSAPSPYRAYLLTLHSQAEHLFTVKMFERHGKRNRYGRVWLGLFRKERNAPLRWVDRKPLEYEAWATDQDPNPYHTGTWMDFEKYPGLWQSVQDPFSGGRYAKYAQVLCKTRKETIVTKTVIHTTPTPRNGTCPESWLNFADSCYKAYPDLLLTFDIAAQNCAKYTTSNSTGEVAKVHNQAHNEVLRSYAERETIVPDVRRLWIGLRKNGLLNRWTWGDGSRISYSNWGPGGPIDRTGIRDCVYIDTTNGLWHHEVCNRPLGFICDIEKDYHSVTSGSTDRIYKSINTLVLMVILYTFA